MQRHHATIVALIVMAASAGCSSLLSDPTPVPGAAATLTRSSRTPIPTPIRTNEPSPSSIALPSPGVLGSPSASPGTASAAASEAEIAQVQRQMEQAVASPDLPGIEGLLLDHISLSTPQGGSVLDASAAAAWLRDHAGTGIKVTRLERATQALMLQVFTEGWPNKDPFEQGQVNFSLRRYDANGRLDEDSGDWKIDVIEAD